MSRTLHYVTPAQAERLGGPLRRRLSWLRVRAMQRLADGGVPSRALGEAFRAHRSARQAAEAAEVVHAPTMHRAPLPVNVAEPTALDADPGWWGFALRDVPARRVDAVEILTLRDVRVLAGRTDDGAGDFSPAILDAAGASLDLREIRYRPFHAPLARRVPDLRVSEAVWIAERVFDNHSHWLSAHLPKLVLLRDRGLLDVRTLVLPASRPARIDASLRMLGIEPQDCRTVAVGQVLAADLLTVVACDRFHPALLDRTRAVLSPSRTGEPRRLFVSRDGAKGRRLLVDGDLNAVLAAHAFEPVAMERMSFADQVARCADAPAMLAPHGAGLTNMLFMPPGATVIEIADPDYPNPNFYAMAAALGLRYALIPARGMGGGHPLHRDLHVSADALRGVLEGVL